MVPVGLFGVAKMLSRGGRAAAPVHGHGPKDPVARLIAVAVLSLALGIGANSSSFTAVNAMILEPFPFPNLERILALWETMIRVLLEYLAGSNLPQEYHVLLAGGMYLDLAFLSDSLLCH